MTAAPDEVSILAVDDVEENLVALSALLRRPNQRLVQCRSGTQALEALLTNDIALALVDVNMPVMDGFDLAELMRGSERTRHVPIIFLTASAPERGRVFQGYEAGAVDFLFKPIDPHLLASKVDVFAQLHRQKRQLAAQLEEIQQAQRMSNLFVGVLGHDLRNPLGSIMTAARLIERRAAQALPEDEEGRCKAQVILRASERMERLIRQVLDFAVARVKGIPIRPRAADLAAVARQAIAELDSGVSERVRVEVVGDPTGHWDADRLMQAVANLLWNAVEHGAADAPIDVRIDGDARGEVRFEIRNGGVIEQPTLDALFAPFKGRERGASKGVGLGLYIVHEIVRAHGGTITVRSTAPEGTTFVIRLPRTAPATGRGPGS